MVVFDIKGRVQMYEWIFKITEQKVCFLKQLLHLLFHLNQVCLLITLYCHSEDYQTEFPEGETGCFIDDWAVVEDWAFTDDQVNSKGRVIKAVIDFSKGYK